MQNTSCLGAPHFCHPGVQHCTQLPVSRGLTTQQETNSRSSPGLPSRVRPAGPGEGVPYLRAQSRPGVLGPLPDPSSGPAGPYQARHVSRTLLASETCPGWSLPAPDPAEMGITSTSQKGREGICIRHYGKVLGFLCPGRRPPLATRPGELHGGISALAVSAGGPPGPPSAKTARA